MHVENNAYLTHFNLTGDWISQFAETREIDDEKTKLKLYRHLSLSLLFQRTRNLGVGMFILYQVTFCFCKTAFLSDRWFNDDTVLYK